MDYYPPKLLNAALVMFGGEKQGGGFYGDTWFYDQTVFPANPWSKCTTPNCATTNVCTNPAPPCQRSGHRLVYYEDATGNKRIFLFGGFRGRDSSQLLNDTWFFQGTSPGAWVRCSSSNGCQSVPLPAPRCCVGLAFDTDTDKIVMYGGAFFPAHNAYGDLWVWDLTGVPGWKCLSPSTCNQP
jgi:Kelch motif